MTDSRDHQGFTIRFDPAEFKFRIDEEPLNGQWDRWVSLEAAKGAITEHLAKKAIETRKAAVLKLPVVTEDGTATEIRGIHASQGHILTTDKKEHKEVYVDRPWVRAAVKEKLQLNAALLAVSKKLEPAYISRQRSYGRSGAEAFAERIDALAEEYREAAAKIDAVLDKAGA